MRVSLTNNQHRIDFFPDRILDIARRTLQIEKHKNACVDIIVVDNRFIKQLNYKFRRINRPTDVLAFELKTRLRRQDKENFLGDVFICADVAREQVESLLKKTKDFFTKINKKELITNELALYAVHGILHLLGYSDETEKSYKEMYKRQEDIIKNI